MSFNFSPRIVTDGLVIHLNASNPKSFIDGATTWNTLTRNEVNVPLISAATYNSDNLGSVVFDGVVNYGRIGSATGFTMAPTNVTMLFWIHGNYQGYYLGCYKRDITLGSGLNIPIPSNGWVQVGYSNDGTTNYFILNGIRYLSNTTGRFPYDFPTDHTLFSSNPDGYFNANATSNISFNLQAGSGGFATGPFIWTDQNYRLLNVSNTSGNRRFFSGNTASVMIYNRTLSQGEIDINYNAMKTRYGL